MLGILLERGVIRVLLRRNVIPIYIVLATIAISYVIQNAAQAGYGSATQWFPQVFSKSTMKIMGVTAQTEAWVCLAVSLVLMLALHFFMTRTKFGTAMRAAAMDPLAAASCGINTSLSTGITWGLSAGIASLAGMLLGPMYGVFTMLGATIGRKGFAGAVIGGYGNMYGAMLGGMILGLIETFAAGYWAGLTRTSSRTRCCCSSCSSATGIFNEGHPGCITVCGVACDEREKTPGRRRHLCQAGGFLLIRLASGGTNVMIACIMLIPSSLCRP